MDSALAELADSLTARVVEEMRQLVAISTPSGEIDGTERAIELCEQFLPGWSLERLPCSTSGCAPDLLATVTGNGRRRLLFLGHLDTVVSHAEHQSARADGERLYGSGTADMKGGVALSLAVARACAEQPDDYAELAVLLVCDEEWRVAQFAHTERFAGYDACLCFEAGEISEGGDDGVIVRRKGAGTMRVRATGRASHSGSANAAVSVARMSKTSSPAGGTTLIASPDLMIVGTTVSRAGPSGSATAAPAIAAWASASSALRPCCGAEPECDARPVARTRIVPAPLRRTITPSSPASLTSPASKQRQAS